MTIEALDRPPAPSETQQARPVLGLHGGCLTAAAVCLAGAFFVLAFLPAHPAGSRA